MESELRSWLERLCRGFPGAEAGWLVLGAQRVAWPAERPASPRLAATVEAARERGGPVGQPAEDAVGLAHAAVPIREPGAILGALGVSLRGVGPADLKHASERLAAGARALEPVVAARRAREGQDALLALIAGLLDHDHTPEAAHALAAELARREGCERVAIGLVRAGRLRVVALSTGLRFRVESETVRDLCEAMEEAVAQDARIDLPRPVDGADPALAVRAHELLLEASGASAVSTVPLPARGRTVGALLCEWAGEPGAPTGHRGAGLEDVAALCAPILALQERADHGPVARARAALRAALERRLGPDRTLAKAVLGTAAALLLLLAVFPATYRVGARATLEGRVQRALVAGVNGYLAEANARAGDVVAAGDVLARLDDRDLALARRSRESEKLQLEKSYREALAARDRTQVSILRAQIEQAEAKLALADEQLARTRVIAPFDGVVLEGDLDQSLGSPVELGAVLFELAPLDGYRIVLEVDGRDIAELAPGQPGRLALSAMPGRTLPLTVERITPVSTTEDGRHFFRVEAALDEPADALRPGMEGHAKVEVGRRRVLWIWTHGLLDWLRMRLWAWLP